MKRKDLKGSLICILIATFVSPPAYAELLKLTFSGTVGLFSDPAQVLPFPQPGPGSEVRFSSLVDTEKKVSGGDYIAIFPRENPSLQISNQEFDANASDNVPLDIGLVIGNDVSGNVRAGYSGLYFDSWEIGTGFDGGSEDHMIFGVRFITGFEEQSGGPIDLTGYVEGTDRREAPDFFVPDPVDWEEAVIYFEVYRDGELIGAMNAPIVAVTATPVPVPASIWLFGSGLLAIAGYARQWGIGR